MLKNDIHFAKCMLKNVTIIKRLLKTLSSSSSLADASENGSEVFNMIGYRSCRDCGQEVNCADLVGGLCPECARSRTARLADLQRQYEAALEAGEPGASARVAEIIRDYQRSEGVRLQAVPARYRMD